MTSVLLIAATTGYQIRSFGEAAAALGVRLVIASDRCGELQDPWWDGAIPVRFHDMPASVRAIGAAFAGGAPDGVMAVGDRPAVLAAHVAEAFGRPGHPPAAAAASRNKLATRDALAGAGLRTPEYRTVAADTDPRRLAAGITYPAVIKPLALSGSRGVIRVDDEAAFVTGFGRLRRILASPDVQAERDAVHTRVAIESYIPGQEFALEGVLTHGALRLLALFDKPDPLEGPCFEETLYVTPSRAAPQVQEDIAAAVAAAARAIGLWHGPIHAECRVNGRGVYLLEVAARPIGGLCAAALRFVRAGGPLWSLEALLLRHATGGDLAGVEREASASGVMMIPVPARGVYRGVRGLDAARAVRGVEDIRITARPDTLLVPLPEGRSYLGFIFARAEAPADVEGALRTAHACLRFDLGRAMPVL